MKKNFYINQFLIILLFVYIFLFPKSYIPIFIIFLLILINILYSQGSLITKIRNLIISYSQSVSRTFFATFIPILLFLSYSYKNIFVALYLLSILILLNYLFFFVKSLFIVKKVNLKLSSTSISDYKSLEAIFLGLPLDISYEYMRGELYNSIQVSSSNKDNIKDVVHINYPDIIITNLKKKRSKSYKKYLLIDSSYNYYGDILNILKDNKNVSFSFILRNPYRFKDLCISVLKIESSDKTVLNRISVLLSNNKRKSILFPSKKLSNIFKPIESSNKLTDLVKHSLELNVPSKVLDNKGVFIGFNHGKKVMLKDIYLKSHSYLIGKTGAGKSIFMKNVIIQNIKNLNSTIVVDPHNLSDMILSELSLKDKKNIVLVDFADIKYSINPLDLNHSINKYLLIDNIVSIFKDLYSEFWGPQSDDILRRSLSALIFSQNNYNILDLEEFLTDEHFRLNVLLTLKDRDTLDYFDSIFSKWDNRSRMERISPIINKVGRLKSDKFISSFVSGKNEKLDLDTLIDKGKSIIFSIPKNVVGEENSKFLGSLIINQIRNTIIQKKNKRDVYLYIDEFQNFISDNFLFIFSESRKYNLFVFVANQYIDQVDKKYLSSIIENCSNFYIMDTGENSRKYLSDVIKFDIPSNLNKYLIYSKNGNNSVYTIYSTLLNNYGQKKNINLL